MLKHRLFSELEVYLPIRVEASLSDSPPGDLSA